MSLDYKFVERMLTKHKKHLENYVCNIDDNLRFYDRWLHSLEHDYKKTPQMERDHKNCAERVKGKITIAVTSKEKALSNIKKLGEQIELIQKEVI